MERHKLIFIKSLVINVYYTKIRSRDNHNLILFSMFFFVHIFLVSQLYHVSFSFVEIIGWIKSKNEIAKRV